MRAATISDGSVAVAEHDDPEPAKGELLVRVRAAGINGADILQRKGAYPAPPGSPADIPGLELAGEVVAAGPGVGTAAVQLGRSAGAHVTATVRSEEKRPEVERLGATAIDPEGFEDHGPFDVILELVGAPNLPANLKALNTGGRIAVIGIGAGAKAELNLGLLMAKRARIHGSTLRSRPLEEKAAAARLVERHLLPLVARERDAVRVPVHRTFALDDVA